MLRRWVILFVTPITSSMLMVFPKRPGISTEPLSSKAEFDIWGNEIGCLGIEVTDIWHSEFQLLL